MKDLISIIVPVYNVEQYLDKCVQSIVDQTYTNLEIILIDDGSPDNCPKMCDEWAEKDSRIKVIHKKNSGVSSARNIGLKKFTGDWLMFIDADDYIETNTIFELIELTRNFKCEIIKFSGQQLNSDYTHKLNFVERVKQGVVSNSYYIKYLLTNMACAVWGNLYRKDIVENVFFDETMANKEDMLFLIQVASKSKEIYVSYERYYNYVMHDNSSSSVSYEKTLDYLVMLKELDKIFSNTNEYNKEILACKITSHYIIAKRLWQLGIKDENYKQSICFLRKNMFHVINPFFKIKKIRLKVIFVCYFKWIVEILNIKNQEI